MKHGLARLLAHAWVSPPFSFNNSLLFLGKYATKVFPVKQSVFPLLCQTLQGKHYRLNCLIPICIIRRSDSLQNQDAKGRLTSYGYTLPASRIWDSRSVEQFLDQWFYCITHPTYFTFPYLPIK